MAVLPTARRERFRALLTGDRCIHPASVWDPLSVRIADELGFEAGILAGSTASLAVLGAPDLIVLTLPELAEQARRIGRASGLPLLVDADHGYGNALSAMRTVQELEAAGVAALTIEDTDLPRPFGSTGPRLVPVEEGVGKLRAALAARNDPALVVVARTSALALTGTADAVARVRAYAAAGADAIFLAGVEGAAQVAAIADATALPLIVALAQASGGDAGAHPAVRIALQGHQAIMAGVAAVYGAMRALRDGRPVAGLPDPSIVRAVTRGAVYEEWQREFLGG